MSHFLHLQTLLKLERTADQEQYRQKVMVRSLSGRVKEGTTWYPVRLNRTYIGTGERNVIGAAAITRCSERAACEIMSTGRQTEQPQIRRRAREWKIKSRASGRRWRAGRKEVTEGKTARG